MSDNTENVTVVGAVDGPRAEIIQALRENKGLAQGNVCEVFNLNPADVFVPQGTAVVMTDDGLAGPFAIEEIKERSKEWFGVPAENLTIVALEGDVNPTTRAGQLHIAIDDLLESGEIHSQKGRQGGLKLGPKPPPTAKSASASAFAKIRKNKGEGRKNPFSK